jgi:hypothetical protein
MEGCGSQNGGWWCEPKWLPVSHSCHRRWYAVPAVLWQWERQSGKSHWCIG